MTPAQMALIHARAFTTQRPWSVAEFKTLLAQPSTRMLPDENGFLLLRILPPDAEILTLAVLPGAQRQGIARALLNKSETLARAEGVTRLFLEVAAGNSSARALYRSAGFDETGTRPGYYTRPDGTRDDAVMMAREIRA
ncbi:GNAT family N-acetyltransferase [Rhodophyticola sp. CCM32]|uniref:GNAT family N-acetyltransferase n=1 Tax=Rhodophyticola sp. CCM32 TaxID=2916397 RepID=UPI00107F87AB|nr:GNAT family N-acetyltransferase [Rhodophyticola sp. CCM32]QBX99610.1 GNAT family N-acetyltransferase [Rhodophyticola sp. CCM32]